MNYYPKEIMIGKFRLLVTQEVYEPREDTFLLARNLSVNMNDRILDMGTGCGALAVLAAQKTSKIVAVDINPNAVACTRKNAEINGFQERIETRLGNLFEVIEKDERFDLILFNAPYLPTEKGEGRSWLERAWSGGRTGRMVIDRFIETAPSFLMEAGRILLVQSSLSNPEKTRRQFEQQGLHTAIIDEEGLFFERIFLIEARRKPS